MQKFLRAALLLAVLAVTLAVPAQAQEPLALSVGIGQVDGEWTFAWVTNNPATPQINCDGVEVLSPQEFVYWGTVNLESLLKSKEVKDGVMCSVLVVDIYRQSSFGWASFIVVHGNRKSKDDD